MAKSQNGWPVYDSQQSLAISPWLTGRIAPGDVETVLNYVFDQFDARVEPIRRAESWGWAKRPIRGQTRTISNHASATAGDLNAPDHPLGSRGTFSTAQVAEIQAILAEVDHVIRWGGNYRGGRKDEMHFEVNKNAKAVAKTAARIRNKENKMNMNTVVWTDPDGTKVTLAMALRRAQWAYDSQLGTGYTAQRLAKLERPVVDYDGRPVDVHTAAQRGAHAYGAILSTGWLGRALSAVRARVSQLGG